MHGINGPGLVSILIIHDSQRKLDRCVDHKKEPVSHLANHGALNFQYGVGLIISLQLQQEIAISRAEDAARGSGKEQEYCNEFTHTTRLHGINEGKTLKHHIVSGNTSRVEGPEDTELEGEERKPQSQCISSIPVTLSIPISILSIFHTGTLVFFLLCFFLYIDHIFFFHDIDNLSGSCCLIGNRRIRVVTRSSGFLDSSRLRISLPNFLLYFPYKMRRGRE